MAPFHSSLVYPRTDPVNEVTFLAMQKNTNNSILKIRNCECELCKMVYFQQIY